MDIFIKKEEIENLKEKSLIKEEEEEIIKIIKNEEENNFNLNNDIIKPLLLEEEPPPPKPLRQRTLIEKRRNRSDRLTRAIMISNSTNQQENVKDFTNTTISLTPSPLASNNNEMNNLNILQQKKNIIITKRPSKREIKDAYCCCGSIHLQYFVIGITIVELVFYGYQLVTYLFELFFTPVTSNNNIESMPSLTFVSEESPSVELLSLFFVLFSLLATVLLPIAWYTRSCHLSIPHLIMQFGLLSATLIIMCYIMAWIFGGIDLQISAIFFENSPLGEEGLKTASQRTPIEAHFTITHMQMALAFLLFSLAILFIIQLWLFHLMLRVFRYIRDKSCEKLAKSNSNNNFFMKTENGGTIESNNNNKNNNMNNLSFPKIIQQGGGLSPPSLKTCANISSPQLPNTSTTSTTATFSVNSSPPPLVLPETIRIHQPTIQMPGNNLQPYNSFSSPAVYYEVQQHPQPQMRKELHV